ncbi:MAG: transporter [Flavobacteriaceae bacterium]
MYKKIMLLVSTVVLWFGSAIAQENLWSSARPDGHAPIRVMGDHYHQKGEVMFSYRFMPMWMDGNLQGSKYIDNENIYQNYMAAPQKMVMNMHMLGAMYAPTDRLTLMVMGNFISNAMNLRTKMGADFTTESSGFGDITLGGLIKLHNTNQQSWHAKVGVSIPTGNINQRDDTPMATNTPLAYPMQLGSGTWDPSLGLTYLAQSDGFSWGAQVNYLFRLGENEEDYSLGDKTSVNAWAALKVSETWSVSTGLYYTHLQSIDGVDADLNPMMMPLFNAANSGRSQMDLGVGANFYVPRGSWKNLRLAAELSFPLVQDATGIQMKHSFIATVGLQYALGHHD